MQRSFGRRSNLVFAQVVPEIQMTSMLVSHLLHLPYLLVMHNFMDLELLQNGLQRPGAPDHILTSWTNYQFIEASMIPVNCSLS